MTKMIEVSGEAYQEHDDNYDGICLKCGEWTCGGCEPDARGYTCPLCGEHAVYGAAEALIMGRLDISDE